MSIKEPVTGWKFKRTTMHPGEYLREEFLVPLGMSANALAMRLRIARRGSTPSCMRSAR